MNDDRNHARRADDWPAPARVSVVIADGQPVFRRGLAALLTGSGAVTVVAEAAASREAARMVVLHRPDVLVLDLELADGQVDATVREVLRAAPATAVLVFTAADDEDTLVAAMRAGARGYLLKSSADAGIVRAVIGLAQGETILGPGIGERLVGRIGGPPARFQRLFPELTAREQDVLELLAAGMGNTAIARQLHLSPKTIANHISVIFGKLHVTNRVEAAELAKGGRRGPLELVRDPAKPARRPGSPPAGTTRSVPRNPRSDLVAGS
jgi:DNA-binding NarL/FixJ family response regulator